jgi:hypothetical protein
MDFKISSLIILGIAIAFYFLFLTTENETSELCTMTTNQSLIKCAQKSAFVVGYTGEVGKELVRELLEKRIFKKSFLNRSSSGSI